jgi:tRNA threonylcarbamoyladenosine biosynthesis protein TsaE
VGSLAKIEQMEIITHSPEETESLGYAIGSLLRGGEVLELVSDVGGGKTTFTRGLARGIGSADRVASPTFTISKVYEGPSLRIVHFDFYRLHEAGLMAHELEEIERDAQTVTVVEWGDIVADVLPKQRLVIRIHYTETGDDARRFTFELPKSLQYLEPALTTEKESQNPTHLS